MTTFRTAGNLADQQVSDFQHWPPWRPLVVATATELARFTGQHLIAPQTILVRAYLEQIFAGLRDAGLDVFHVVLDAGEEVLRRARAAGLPAYVETRPLYLHLTRERFAEPDAAKYVGAPPLREQSDREALWAGLAAGDVDTLCSDHAPWTLDAKLDPALTAVTARQGVADLETLMPMLYSEGVASA